MYIYILCSEQRFSKLKQTFNKDSQHNSSHNNTTTKTLSLFNHLLLGINTTNKQLQNACCVSSAVRNNTKSLIKHNSNIKCKCKNSKCLKNYCECFSNGQFCKGGCHCVNCFNTALLEDKVNKAKQIRYIKKSKSLNSSSVVTCKCAKSFCHKKYCECYNKGIPCNDKCKCKQCKNKEHNESIYEISAKLNEINYTNHKRQRKIEGNEGYNGMKCKKKFVMSKVI